MSTSSKMAAWQHDWYVRNRRNKLAWREVNSQRAKLWRAANRDHARKYGRIYRLRKKVKLKSVRV